MHYNTFFAQLDGNESNLKRNCFMLILSHNHKDFHFRLRDNSIFRNKNADK